MISREEIKFQAKGQIKGKIGMLFLAMLLMGVSIVRQRVFQLQEL